jgi:hypothetical protein
VLSRKIRKVIVAASIAIAFGAMTALVLFAIYFGP